MSQDQVWLCKQKAPFITIKNQNDFSHIVQKQSHIVHFQNQVFALSLFRSHKVFTF